MDVTEFACLGGHARAEKLTADERKESARKASEARWAQLREARQSLEKAVVGLNKLEKKIGRDAAARTKTVKKKKKAKP